MTFSLGDQPYGVEDSSVQEIEGYANLTPNPHAPPSVKGLMSTTSDTASTITPATFAPAATTTITQKAV